MRTNRDRTLKIRVTEDELARLSAPFTINGRPRRGLSGLLRARLLSAASEQTPPDNCQHCRLLIATVNNLNVIARRCADLVSPTTAVQIIAHLAAVEREIRQAAGLTRK